MMQSDVQDVVAAGVFDCVDPHGHKLTITVQIGRPVQLDTGGAACTLAMHGLDHKPHDLYGEDTLQALCLAIRHARTLMEDFHERGGQLDTSDLSEEEAEDVTFEKLLEAVFGRLR